ncbi:MAG: ATP-binding cassette domain-containing protein [Planctomycetota bacterium]|nr:ATP-binding cassette domain-containing protein [Planctomycetota bacterium]
MSVLRNIGLHIDASELVAIVGPSGSGKSTLLHCIAGVVMPDSGTITIEDSPVHNMKPHLRPIGIVMQDQPLYEHLSVQDNVGFPLRSRRVRKSTIEQRVVEILKSLQLSNISNRIASQLSGGERRRVAIGRAIILKPRLLLLDEPLISLDSELRNAISTLIQNVHNEIGATTLVVTHDQHEASNLGNRVIRMQDLNPTAS